MGRIGYFFHIREVDMLVVYMVNLGDPSCLLLIFVGEPHFSCDRDACFRSCHMVMSMGFKNLELFLEQKLNDGGICFWETVRKVMVYCSTTLVTFKPLK